MTATYLITGACGEIGTGLINYFSKRDGVKIVALDINEPQINLDSKVVTFIKGSITDRATLENLERSYSFDRIFHLAGVLSTGGEKNPLLAHEVNVQGTLGLLALAQRQSAARGVSTRFIFPSTIAVYGFAGQATKAVAGRVTEEHHLNPVTMYGINKLYCEKLGEYFSRHYQLLGGGDSTKIDFRSVRLPGVISTDTIPTGGTSDYGPEMVHAAAQGLPYRCFVRADATLPFMVMPDAVKSLISIAEADGAKLSQRVYNVTSFSLSAAAINSQILEFFPDAQVTFEPHAERQYIVDSWPAEVNDDIARRDWGWSPDYDLKRSFAEYIIPNITERYTGPRVANY